MNIKRLYLIAVAVVAVIVAWYAFSEAPAPTPPNEVITEETAKEDTKKIVEENKCPEIIRLYQKLEFERKVLGNDYITPELEEAYRRCT